jgi:hypothetical protein
MAAKKKAKGKQYAMGTFSDKVREQVQASRNRVIDERPKKKGKTFKQYQETTPGGKKKYIGKTLKNLSKDFTGVEMRDVPYPRKKPKKLTKAGTGKKK